MKRHVITALAELTLTLSMFTCYASAQPLTPWDQFGFVPSGGRDNIYETKIGQSNVSSLKQLWTFAGAATMNGQTITLTPTVDNEMVFVGAYTSAKPLGALYALSEYSGLPLWSFTNGFGPPQSSATIDNGVVFAWFRTSYANSNGALYALNETTGAVLWSLPTSSWVLSVTAANGVLYFGTLSGTVYAVYEGGGVVWTFQAGSGIYFAPAVLTSTAYVGDKSGDFYALDTNTGTELAHVQLAGAVGSPIVYNPYPGLIEVFVNAGTEVYRLSPGLAIGWEYYNSSGWRNCAMKADNAALFCPGRDNALYALNDVGGLTWKYSFNNTGTSDTPAIANDVVYVGSAGGAAVYVYALNQGNGALLWSRKLGQQSTSDPTVVDGVLLIASQGPNALYSFAP